MTKLLDAIHSPDDLKKLSKEQLPELARQVRDVIIETISETGGHLGAGLGVTDLTVALHYVLDTPGDFLVWDVGHQAQAHKILTGRRERFRKTYRQFRGISPFLNKNESEYDTFITGHGGNSISAALGVANARRLNNKGGHTVAVIGDTSIASGMALEALNHAGHIREDLVVILNDNEMSISTPVGAMSRYLNRIISNPLYNQLHRDVEGLIRRVPRVGKRMSNKIRQIEEGVKSLLVPGQLFQDLGFRYFGPLDGHNVVELVNILPNILKIKGPLLVHVLTQKGKGLAMAEQDPVRWHASLPFNIATGEVKQKPAGMTYTKLFGKVLCELAEKDTKIAALTAAMCDGTGLVEFSRRFPDRFYDVGISEEHGVSFCAGLAHEGMKPVAAIYSTFLQRSFDQIVHDVALQKLPVMFCLDRAGLVGEDGPTHHGALDIAYLRQVPEMVLMAPRDGGEFRQMLEFMAVYDRGPIAVRYPRGELAEVQYPPVKLMPRAPLKLGKAEVLTEGNDVCLIALGSMVAPCLEAGRILREEGIGCTVVNTRFVKPLDRSLIRSLAGRSKAVLTVEEGCLMGGLGSAVIESLTGSEISLSRIKCLGIPDRFVEHGARETLLDQIGLSPKKIAGSAKEVLAAGKAGAEDRPVSPKGRKASISASSII